MPSRVPGNVLDGLRRAALRQDETGLTDGLLLGLFVEHHDQAAFEALLRRHGPMVWGVCRRLLGNHQDAEDAFQATFLVLVRKAASVRPRGKVAGWLYGVACQTAARARATAARRGARERQVEHPPEPAAPAPEQDGRQDVKSLLDRELRRLPDRYRLPFVLCVLEGRPRKEVARQLGWREGTLSGRLARARKLLAGRLARRGLGLSAVAAAALLERSAVAAAVPPGIVAAALRIARLRAVPRGPSAEVGALAEGVLRAMFLARLQKATAVFAIVLVLCAGSAVAVRCGPADQRQAARTAEATPPPAGAQQGAAGTPKPTADGPGPWAWGKEVNGLKAGIRFTTRQTRFRLGDVIEFEVMVRNVSDQPIRLPYLTPGAFLADIRPDGRILIGTAYSGNGIPFEETVEPGKDWPVNPYRATFHTRAPGPNESLAGVRLEVRPGKYKVGCTDLLLWPKEHRENPRTGPLDLEVLPAADGGEKPAPHR